MAEAIIRQAEDTLGRGDMRAAQAAKKSFEYHILSRDRADLIGEYTRIYGRNEYIERTGILS